jgi:hypothetical protein
MFYVNPKLRFRFFHVREEKSYYSAKTICVVEKIYEEWDNNWRPIAQGIARCSKGDVFSRATGRKLSLERALLSANLKEKEVRKQIWKTYFSKVSDLKRKG